MAVNHQLDHTIQTKSYDSVSDLHRHDLDLYSNHIYLFGIEDYNAGAGGAHDAEPGVEYIMANRFIRNMNLCMRANPEQPVVIHMKTGGGYWEEGMAIYDTIKSCPHPVTILVYTMASSMSSIILQAANKRVMMPHSHFLFHDGSTSVGGTVKQVHSTIEFGKIQDQQMMDIYSEAIGRSAKFIDKTEAYKMKWLRAQMDKKEDVYLTPDQAVLLGFADDIFDYNWPSLIEYTTEELQRG